MDTRNLSTGIAMDYDVQVHRINQARPLAVVRRRARGAEMSRVVVECCGLVWNALNAAVKAWCSKNGYELSGVRWEIYGHWLEEWNKDASKIRTDVQYLIK